MPKVEFNLDTVKWARTLTQLDILEYAIDAADVVVLDLETTGLDEFAWEGGRRNGKVGARIVLAALTLPVEGGMTDADTPTWLVPLSHPEGPWPDEWRKRATELFQMILDSGKGVIGQNIKFDTRWVVACTGVDLSKKVVWDTRISSHLLDENHSTSLKERAHWTFKIPRWDDFSLKEPGAAEKVPLKQLGEYAARDTFWTWQLARAHRAQMYLSDEADFPPIDEEEITEARLGRLAMWCAMPTAATLGCIEQRGIRVDRAWIKEELGKHDRRAARISDELSQKYTELGARGPGKGVSFAPTSHWFRDWTAGAVAAGDLKVAELTPRGKPSWGKGVLIRQWRRGSTVAGELLELRSSLKKCEYLRVWDRLQDKGVIHAHYNQGSVVTGRLSSSLPNMQQVTSTLRPAFIPRDGFVFADLDYSQIELRAAAHIAQCVPMIEAFQRGDDLHRMLAAKVTGQKPEEVTKTERQFGKAGNFGLLYGMGAYGFRMYAEEVYDVALTNQEAMAIYSAFFEMWDGMAKWHIRAARRAQNTGLVVSPIGRVRRLPSAGSLNPERAGYAERQAINSPVQGFASDIMQIAAASIAGNMPGVPGLDGVHIVATVHDSILVEVPADDWERATRECIDVMLGVDKILARMDCHLSVPLAVEAKIGTRWGLDDLGTMK